MDDRRQFVVDRVDAVAEFAQRVEERLLGTFMHPLDAVNAVHPLAQAGQGGEKPRRCTGVADVQIRLLCGNLAVLPNDCDRTITLLGRIRFDRHLEAEFLQ